MNFQIQMLDMESKRQIAITRSDLFLFLYF